MKIRTLLLLIVLAAVCVFAALNWQQFMTPATLSLGVTAVQAPLGLIMLAILAFITALFLVFVIYLQASVLSSTRRHAREIEANRKLADDAEASRFTELRNLLESQFNRQSELHAETRDTVLARIEGIEQNLQTVIEESGNTLAAYFAELEDRLEKEAPGLENNDT